MGQKNFFAKIAFLFFLFLFPQGEALRVHLFPNVSIHPSDIVIGILAVCSVPLFLKNRNHYLFRPILFLAGVFLLSLAVNIFNYDLGQLYVAALYYLRFVFLLLLLPLVYGFSNSFKKRIPVFLTVAGFLFLLFGYIQYFFYSDLRNLYYAGWDEHLYRMFSTFLDPNFAGAFFVMYFMFVLGMVFEKSNNKYWYGLLGVLTLGAIFLTYSRSAYIMLGISLIVFFLVKKQKKLLFWVIGLVLLLPILFFLSPKSEGTNLLRTTSSNARILAMDQAITIIKDNPIFGVGFNTYRYEQEKRGFLVETTRENHAGAGTDNSFLFVLATTGIVGLSAYLYFWYAIIRQMLKQVQHDNQWLRIVVISTVIGLFVNALFINSLFYPFILEFLFIELAIIDYTSQ